MVAGDESPAMYLSGLLRRARAMCCPTRISYALTGKLVVTASVQSVTSEASRGRLSHAAYSDMTMISAGIEPAIVKAIC